MINNFQNLFKEDPSSLDEQLLQCQCSFIQTWLHALGVNIAKVTSADLFPQALAVAITCCSYYEKLLHYFRPEKSQIVPQLMCRLIHQGIQDKVS